MEINKLLKLSDYDLETTFFEGTIEDLWAYPDNTSGSNKYWFTDSDLASMDSEDYEYVTENHFQHDGKYCKYEFVEEVDL